MSSAAPSAAILPRRVPGFDGLRAAACLWVVAVHFSQSLREAPFWNHSVLEFCLRGELGVPIFFALSGFLLAWPFMTGAQSPRDQRKFAVDRLARIFPAYLTCLAVLGTYQFLHQRMTGGAEVAVRVASAAVCVNVWHPATVYPLARDAALWSVPVECWFYGLFGLALPFLFRRSEGVVRRYLTLLALAIAVALAVPSVLAAVQPLWNAVAAPGGRWDRPEDAFGRGWMDTHNPLALFPQFLAGVGLCLLATNCPRLWTAGRRRWPFDLAAVALLAAMVCVDWHVVGPFGVGVGTAGKGAAAYGFPTFHLLTVGFMFCLIFSARLAAWLDGRALRSVARYSFGIYLWHTPVLFLLERFGVPTTGTGAALLFLAVLGMSYAVGAASFHVVEQPSRKWLQRRFGRRGADGRGPVPRRNDPPAFEDRTAAGAELAAARP